MSPHTDDQSLSSSNHYEVLYSLFILLVGAAVRHANEVTRIPVPYTVIVFFFGMVLGTLPTGAIVNIGPHTIITVFIPVLIFEGAFFIDMYIFREIAVQVLILAIPALAFMIALTALTSVYLFESQGWGYQVGFLFGSVLSATDPVAVVAIMKELGASKHLSLLIEGESMLNDGTAMISFQFFLNVVMSTESFDTNDIPFQIMKVIMVCVGGPLVGLCMAMVSVFWLQRTFNDSLSEICITLSMSYMTFYLADAMLEVSGVLAVVTFGLMVGDRKTCFSPEVEGYLHSFWETLSFIANTFIFALCGLIVVSNNILPEAGMADFMRLILLYTLVQCIRLVTIFLFQPLMKRVGKELTWQEGLVCAWSGLRGAMGLAFALIVYKSMGQEGDNGKISALFLFHVAMFVVATLLINATTIKILIDLLGMTDLTSLQRQSMEKAIQMLDDSLQKTRRVWSVDRFLTNADWETVGKLCTIEDPYKVTETVQEKEQRERTHVTCPECHTAIPYVPTQSEIEQKKVEAVSKFVKLLKRSYWRQFEKGLLTGTSFRRLIDMAENVSTTGMVFLDVRQFRRYWKNRPWKATWVNCIGSNSVNFSARDNEEHNKRSQAKRAFYQFCKHWMLLTLVIGVDAAINLTALIVCMIGWNTSSIDQGLRLASAEMLLISLLYFIFRISVFKERYIRTPWFLINLIFVLFIPLDLFILYDDEQHSLHAHNHLCEVRNIHRSLRALQLLEILFLFLHHELKTSLYKKVRIACDMARGFVRAHEHALRMLEHISDQGHIQNTIKQASDRSKLEMLRELGILQGRHNNIANEVKTSHAIRALLNVMREGIRKLMEEGAVDEMEGTCFIEVIESEMKYLKVSPPKLASPSIPKILSNISWIGKNEKLIHFIQSRVHHLMFGYGSTIMNIGDESDGVFFIISGLVKLETSESVTSFIHTQYLSTGNVVGEISTLTGLKRSAMLTCETVVKALHLTKEDFFEALNTFTINNKPLLKYMWRTSALRIALNVLYRLPNYKIYNKETLLSRLENSSLSHLKDVTKFQVLPAMKNIVLILGKATGNDGKEYQGPCYIPPGVTSLKIAKEEAPTPLILYDMSQPLRKNTNRLHHLQQAASLLNSELPEF